MTIQTIISYTTLSFNGCKMTPKLSLQHNVNAPQSVVKWNRYHPAAIRGTQSCCKILCNLSSGNCMISLFAKPKNCGPSVDKPTSPKALSNAFQ